MTEQPQSDLTNMEGDPSRATPSQAEGDRETVEQDLAQKFDQSGKPIAGGGQTETTPSQAEGDREAIERDLREKGLE